MLCREGVLYPPDHLADELAAGLARERAELLGLQDECVISEKVGSFVGLLKSLQSL